MLLDSFTVIQIERSTPQNPPKILENLKPQQLCMGDFLNFFGGGGGAGGPSLVDIHHRITSMNP